MRIGVLALQGDFAEHVALLSRLGVEACEVRLPEQLEGLDGLVIYKWKLLGSGQTVAPYADGGKAFAQRRLRRACPV